MIANKKIGELKYPAADKISSRSSTICRSMACTLMPRYPCTNEDENKWKKFFSDKECAYCGKKATHLDHLFPLIDKRKPTGYMTEVSNLVPCCSLCNQRKGNINFVEYMRSDKCQYIGDKNDQDKRINKINEFQNQMPAKRICIDSVILSEWQKILTEYDDLLKKTENKLIAMQNKLK